MSTKYREFSAKEAERLRNTATTYSQPLPTPTDIHDAQLSQEMTDFLLKFNKHWKEGKEERQALLEQYPESLGQFHEELMAKDISEKDFWSRYLFRCDEQRIVRYLQRQHDAQKVKKRTQKQHQQVQQAQEEADEDSGIEDEGGESGSEFSVSVSAGSYHSNNADDDDGDDQTTESIMQERNVGPSLQDRLKAWGEATGSVVDEEEEQAGEDHDAEMDDAGDNMSESDGSSSASDAGGTLKERLNRYQRKATKKSRAPPSKLGGMTRSASMEVYLDADDSSTKQRDDDMSAISLPVGLTSSSRSLVSVKERRKVWGASDAASVQSSADTVASAATSDASTIATKRNRPDHKIKGVSKEADRRRDARETYSTPIQRHGYESQALQQDASDFFLEFRVKIWKDEAQRQALLEECPRLKQHHQELVVDTAEVSDRDFWERYYFRCDEDRILREFQRAERKSALVKSIKKQKKMKYDASGEPIIVEDREEDSSGDEDVEILLSPTEVKKFLDVNSDEALKQNVSLEVRKTGLQESTDQEIKKTVDVTAEEALKEHKSLKERKTELGDSKQEQQAKVKKVVDINADAALRENISLKERLTTLKTSNEKEAPRTKVVDPSADENLKSNVPLHERKKALAATAEKSQGLIVAQSTDPATSEKLANVVALAEEREIESTSDQDEQPTLQSTSSAVVEDSESDPTAKQPEDELRAVSSDDGSKNATEDASEASVGDESIETDEVAERDADVASSDSREVETDKVMPLGSDSEMDEQSRGRDGNDVMQSADSDRSSAQEDDSQAGVADSLVTESDKVVDTVVIANPSDENIGSNEKNDDQLPAENDPNQSSTNLSASSVDHGIHEPPKDEVSSESANDEMSVVSDSTKQDKNDASSEPDERSGQDSAASNTAENDVDDVKDVTTAINNKGVVESEHSEPSRGDDDSEDLSMGSSVSVSSSESELDQKSPQSAESKSKNEAGMISAESSAPTDAFGESVGDSEESEDVQQKDEHSRVEESKNRSTSEAEEDSGDDMRADSQASSINDEEGEPARIAPTVDSHIAQLDQLEESPTSDRSNSPEKEIEGVAPAIQADDPVDHDDKMPKDEDSKNDEEDAESHDDTQTSSDEARDATGEAFSLSNDATVAETQDDGSEGIETSAKDDLVDDVETSEDNKSDGASQSEGSSGGSIDHDDSQTSQRDEVDTHSGSSSSISQNPDLSETQEAQEPEGANNQSESDQGSHTSIENGKTEIASSGSGSASEEYEESGTDEDDPGQEEDSKSEAPSRSQHNDDGGNDESGRESSESHPIPMEQDPHSVSAPKPTHEANHDIQFEPDVSIAKNVDDSEHDSDLNDNTSKGSGNDDELDSNENYLVTGPGSLEGVTLELEVHDRSSSEGLDIGERIEGDSPQDHKNKEIVLADSENRLDTDSAEEKSETGTSNSPKFENAQDNVSGRFSRGGSHHESSSTDSQPENEFQDWLSEGSANSKERDETSDGESQGESDGSSLDEESGESADSDMTSSVEDVDNPDSKKSLGSYLDENQKKLRAATSMETDEALVVSIGSNSDDNCDQDQVGSQVDSKAESDTPKHASSKKRKGMRGIFKRKTRVEKMRDRQEKIAARKSSENDETSVKRSKRRANPLKSLGRKLGNRGKAKQGSSDVEGERNGSDDDDNADDDVDSYTSERRDNNGKWDDNSEPRSTIKKRNNPLKQLGRRFGKNQNQVAPSKTANSKEIEEYERENSSNSDESSSESDGRRGTAAAVAEQRSDGESSNDPRQQDLKTVDDASGAMIQNSEDDDDDAGSESEADYGSDDYQDGEDEGHEMDLKSENEKGDTRGNHNSGDTSPATKRGAKDDDSAGNRSQSSFGRLKNRFKKFGQRRRKKNGDEDENVDKVIDIEMDQKDSVEALDDLSSDDEEAASDNEADNSTSRGKSGEDFDDNRSQGSFGRFKNRFKKLGRRRGKKKAEAESVIEGSDHDKSADVSENSKVGASSEFDEVASEGGAESDRELHIPLAGHQADADDSDDNRSQSSFGKFKDRFKKLGRRRQKTSTDKDDNKDKKDDNIDKVVEVSMGGKDDATSDFGDFVSDDGAIASNNDSGLNTRENAVDDTGADDNRSQRSFGRLKDRFKKFGRKRGKKKQASEENNNGGDNNSDSDSDDSVDIQAYQAPRNEKERGNPSRNVNAAEAKSVNDPSQASAGKDNDSKFNPRNDVRKDMHTDYHEGDMDINLKDEIDATATSASCADDGSSKGNNRSQRSIKGRLKSFGRQLGKGRREKPGSFDDDVDGDNLVHEESSSLGGNSKTSFPRDSAINEVDGDDRKVGDGAESVDKSYSSDGDDDAADGEHEQDGADVKQGKPRKNVLKSIRKRLGGRSQEKSNEDDNNSSNTPADQSSKEMIDREDSFGASDGNQLSEKQTKKRRNVLKVLQRKFGDRGSEKQGSAQPLLDAPGSESLSNKDDGIDGGNSTNSNENSHISVDASTPAMGENATEKELDGDVEAEASEKKKSSKNMFGFMKGGMRSGQNRKGNKQDGETVEDGDISSSFDNQDASERSMRSESSSSSTYSKSRKNPLRTISQLFKGKTKKQVVHTVQPVAFDDDSEFSDIGVAENNKHIETPNKVEVETMQTAQSDKMGTALAEKIKDTESLQEEKRDNENVKPLAKTTTLSKENAKVPALTDGIIESLKSGTNHLNIPADLSSDEDDTGKSNQDKTTPTETAQVVQDKQPDSMVSPSSPKAKHDVEKTKSGMVEKAPNKEKAHPKTEARGIPTSPSGRKGKSKKATTVHEGERSTKNRTNVHEKIAKKQSTTQRSESEKETVNEKVDKAGKSATQTVKAKSENTSKLTKTPKKTKKAEVEVDITPSESKGADGEEQATKKSSKKPNKKKMKSQTSVSSKNEDVGEHSSADPPRVKSPKPKKNQVQISVSSTSDAKTEKSGSDPSKTKSPKPKKNKVPDPVLPTDSKESGSNLTNSKSPKPKKSKVQKSLPTMTEDDTKQSDSDLASSKSPKPKTNKVHISSKSGDVTKERGSELASSKSPKPKKNKVLKKDEGATNQSDPELATLKSPKPKSDKLPKNVGTTAEVKPPKPKSEKKFKVAKKSVDDFAEPKKAASETAEAAKKEKKKKKKSTSGDKGEETDSGVVKKVEKKKKTALDGDKEEDTKVGVADKAEKKKKKLPKSVEQTAATVDADFNDELDQSKLKKKKSVKTAQQKESVEETKKVEKLSKKKKSKSVTKD